MLASLLLAQKQQNPACPPLDSERLHSRNHIDKAIEFIDQHCSEDITLSNLANVTGVSIRTLQYGFKNQFNMGPMTYIKHIRMQRAHDALLRAPPGSCRVGDIAAQWGFYNGSVFASLYRKMFGELPSETLARS